MKKFLCLLGFCLVILSTNTAFASSGPIGLNLKNADIRTVLSSLAQLGKVNIILDDSVRGTVTVHIDDILFEQALELIAQTKGLAFQKFGNTYVVATQEAMNKNYRKLHIIKIHNVQADDLKTTLTALIPANSFSVDTTTNSLIFAGSPQQEALLRQALTQLDVAVKQISLEARLISINREHGEKLGIDWQWSQIPQEPSKTNNLGGVIRFGSNYEFRYTATLNALLSKGQANILATPKITTLPGKEATIFIGDRIPVQTERTENSSTIQSTTYIDAGIKLKYTAQITADNTITAKVHTEVSTPTLIPELKNYKISTRRADTNVRLKNGQTLVIGGLIGEEETKNISKIPFLSDLPLLGALFKSTAHTKTKTEVMVFLTPHIVE